MRTYISKSNYNKTKALRLLSVDEILVSSVNVYPKEKKHYVLLIETVNEQ